MKGVRFLSLRAAIEVLALMGIHTQGDMVAANLALKEVPRGS